MKRWLWLLLMIGLGIGLASWTYWFRDQTPGGNGVEQAASDSGASRVDPGGTWPQWDETPGIANSEQARDRVAAPGQPLEQVTEPPSRTIAMIDPVRLPPGTLLGVEFEPFGVGPWGDDSLVIRFVSVSLVDGDGVDVSQFRGSNALVRLEPPAMEVVTEGGAYTGVIRAVADRDFVILSVVEAELLAD